MAKQAEKSQKRITLFTIIAFTIIASGFTSFSNHPTWGYWWSSFGGLILVITLLFKSKKEKVID